MKKVTVIKILLIVVLLVCSIFFSYSCFYKKTLAEENKQTTNNNITTNNFYQAGNSNANSASTGNNNLQSPTSENTNNEFYGQWIIKRVIAFGKVSALSDENIKNYIGKKVEYSKDNAKYENSTIDKVIYKKSIIRETEFFDNNGFVSFKQIGFSGKSIVMVEVFSGKEDYSNLWCNIGGEFFIKDVNTLIASDGGVFFELERKE